MDEVNAWFALYERAASMGFPALLFFVLIANYYGVWEWGKTSLARCALVELRIAVVETRVQEWKTRYESAEQNAVWWRDMALRSTGLTETVTTIAKRVK